MKTGYHFPDPPPEEVVIDEAAASEDIALRTGRDLAEAKTGRELSEVLRDQKIQGHIHVILTAAIYTVAIASFVLFFFLIWHDCAPKKWAYLDADQIDACRQLLFSGGLGASISLVAKSRLVKA